MKWAENFSTAISKYLLPNITFQNIIIGQYKHFT